MVSIRTIVIAPLAAVSLAGCGLVQADPQRFERWAEGVAALPVTAEDAGLRGPMLSAADVGLRGPLERGPRSPMRIEVVEPEVLWEARANGHAPSGLVEAATHAVAEAVVEEAVARAPEVAREVVQAVTRTVQLGAYSNRAAAEAAWARLSGHSALAGVTPRFEPVERDGRTLIRLRAAVAETMAADVCRAAQAGDFCASTGAS